MIDKILDINRILKEADVCIRSSKTRVMYIAAALDGWKLCCFYGRYFSHSYSYRVASAVMKNDNPMSLLRDLQRFGI